MMVDEPQTYSLQSLEHYLHQQEWQAADEITFWLLLQRAERMAEGWLDRSAVANLPCELLHQIDQRWVKASDGKFGFSVQRHLYLLTQRQNRLQSDVAIAARFSHQVGWLIFKPRPLAFLKFYDFLNFSLDAPRGQFPAYWYWKTSWRASFQAGGFGTGRGAGFGDAGLLDAMMLRLERCGLDPLAPADALAAETLSVEQRAVDNGRTTDESTTEASLEIQS